LAGFFAGALSAGLVVLAGGLGLAGLLALTGGDDFSAVGLGAAFLAGALALGAVLESALAAAVFTGGAGLQVLHGALAGFAAGLASGLAAGLVEDLAVAFVLTVAFSTDLSATSLGLGVAFALVFGLSATSAMRHLLIRKNLNI
jgi:hypothetical protein